MMNDSKIFLVNVSKGRIGEDNSALLGGMIITKIQLAAMERVRIPEENRKDFYLYVDEFQNFVTDAFAGILSEARKYRLNLTVAHQYTAQLVVDKSSAVRDAVFGNVGTMIVFRVGSDDAEFLESEFEPEFTPQDIVNLPNYKIYLKLMIDGVTSRPFSAKTLPPLAKGGDKKIEEAVINSSRSLYCRSKETVEREINEWSGMSLGDDVGSGAGVLEKFPVICSLCKEEKTVPFKPEPGRPVYCKECIAKIKSGEVKAEKGRDDQIRYDESSYFKPLADLGIEFPAKDGGNVKSTHNKENHANNKPKEKWVKPSFPKEKSDDAQKKSGIMNSIKKVFVKNHTPVSHKKPVSSARAVEKNNSLREILSKTLAEKEVSTPPVKPKPEPVSLDVLKSPTPSVNVAKNGNNGKDRAASSEDMNKLKDLIQTAQMAGNEPLASSITTPAKATPPPKGGEEIPAKPVVEPPLTKGNIKEVPEDVLRKILE
jgi:CxxC-x17-CxxC domain-containing protein